MKTVEYYMGLPYRMELEPIPAEQGGGFSACIPLLGRYAACADGDTLEEAMANLQKLKRELFSEYISRGGDIPEPEPDQDEYSGKFIVRIPKYLHRELALKARENNVSLNQFVTSILAMGVQTGVLPGKTSGRASHGRKAIMG